MKPAYNFLISKTKFQVLYIYLFIGTVLLFAFTYTFMNADLQTKTIIDCIGKSIKIENEKRLGENNGYN